ncbi:hypothetical protein LY13_002083 [Prauserella aidingensis]|uniref:hypothetical protein n=1 Tax=Prauserella aidingensis TaxID=387890 RepID=UPI0020A25698|nr:hypothetical protein [Prauserella aidingensis]MCP2253333.1 hypothetical protein [Prauserella aidingensis]
MTGRRVAVTSPQTRLAHARRRYRGPWRPTTLDPAEMPRAIALYRSGRSRAVSALAALGALVFGLPFVLWLWPALDEVRVADVPVSWAAIVLVPFPAMVTVAFWQLRRAEQAERELLDADTGVGGGADRGADNAETASFGSFDRTSGSGNSTGEGAS